MNKIRSGEWHTECESLGRIVKLEDKVDEHDKRLSAGDIGFAELRKDVATLTEKVSELIGVLKWCVFGVVGFVATTAGGALLWVVVQQGTKTP
jgi:hypothetical protein